MSPLQNQGDDRRADFATGAQKHLQGPLRLVLMALLGRLWEKIPLRYLKERD